MFATLALAACSSSSKKSSTPSGSDAGSDGGNGFKLDWGVVDVSAPVLDGGANPPLAGVKVCVQNHPEIACYTTGADGLFHLTGLPALADLALTLEKDGYMKELKPFETASTDMTTQAMIFMFAADTKLAEGITPDPTKGSVFFFAVSVTNNQIATEPGIAVSLSPAAKAGQGPFFYSGANYVKGATVLQNGLGFYYNLDPGTYTLDYSVSWLDCAPISNPFGGWGYPSPPSGTKFPIQPGYLTAQVGVLCTQIPGKHPPDAGAEAGMPVEAGMMPVDAGGSKDASTRDH
jgi:hypothetical protein